ncbi:glycosyltransferase family 2 protein [bacterium]|nr:glycosyltransferase family 2 protein [candidate division CSSED10-310 bacterium]
MRISVIMPAYNEQDNIRTTVQSCFQVLDEIPGDHEVVVTDDGSRDRTGEILAEMKQARPALAVETNDPNRGYGAALARAIRRSAGDIVVSIDSDGQFDISELKNLLDRFTANIDILTGYRISKRDTRVKVIADRIMNQMIRLMFGVRFRDTNCAFKLYRGEVIRRMNLEASGFQIPTEIVLKGHAMGLNIGETPVQHFNRSGGSSTLTPVRTAVRMVAFLVYLRLKISLYRRKILRSL